MLLRSSSTPLLGSLLSSISESPNNNPYADTNTISRHATTFHHSHKKLSFNQSISVNSSPMSESSFNLNGPSGQGIRRAHSAGNLQTLAAHGSSSCNGHNESYTSKSPLHKASMLETIPSFSFYNSKGGYVDEEEEQSDEEYEEIFMVKGGGGMNKNAGVVIEKEFVSGYSNVSYGIERDMVQSDMYLARGLGISVGSFGGFGSDCGNGGGGGWGGNFNNGNPGNGAGDGDNLSVEKHYKRMVEENPCNSLFLRNYAQFLYQSKKDLPGAEEYYSRAILADPKDGDILCQYAKLLWELHRDEDRALSYFERAVQASPEDSHVHAAYASFIWEIEDDENEDEDNEVHLGTLPRSYHETMASVVAS